MKVLLTGCDGQLGQALKSVCPTNFELTATNRSQLDITDSAACQTFIGQFKPDWIINAAAYTDVENAEDEPEKAMRVNGDGPMFLATAARKVGARLLHFSTDFVFDGNLRRPYRVDDTADPINSYGRSKLAGEQSVLSVLGEQALVIRTSWLYSSSCRNFLITILRLLREQETLKVVKDQFGLPTSVYSLAPVVFSAMSKGLGGIYHWADAGAVSWYVFARAIQHEALELGLTYKRREILAINSSDYKARAKRPLWSVLDCSDLSAALKIKQTEWLTCLQFTMKKMKKPGLK